MVKGQEKTNVEEYCVSEGWIRVSLGKAVDRRGKPLTMKLTGTVEPYLRQGRSASGFRLGRTLLVAARESRLAGKALETDLVKSLD